MGSARRTGSAPAGVSSAPTRPGSVPARPGSVPARSGSIPARPGSVPARSGSVPAESLSAPTNGVGGSTARGPSRVAAAAGDRGTLYVVATPIGNLGDISLRALEVLRSVALVAAEDTRHTRRLWARHGIATPLVSFHAHSGGSRTGELLDRLASGEDVALVSDAGTPLVSDPGEGLVTAWAANGGRVVPIPGASAVLAALVASGIPAPRWGFEGFLPRRGAERRARLARIAADERATVLFEAPGRTAATLRDLASACGEGRVAAICRELTKLHEEVLRGTLGELAQVAGARPQRGEVTIVISGAPAKSGVAEVAAVTLEEGRRSVAALVAGGLSRSAAARQLAAETGLPRRELFRDEAGSEA